MSRHMIERTTVRLPVDLIKRAKRKAASEGRSLTALIEDGLRRVLNEREGNHTSKRVLPPVSSAAGGLMPGIDLNETAALQELEDFEQVERLK
jgi:predicted component of type VI protein secretion system